MPLEALSPFVREHYEIHEWRHASAILAADFPNELADIHAVLEQFRLLRSQILAPGGAKTLIAGSLDAGLTQRGWVEKKFKTQIRVDATVMETPTHKVDCFKNRVALEIEWNNKDPFFDRDLNNFRLLFDLRAISVGVIITRCDALHERLFKDIAREHGRKPKGGASTTHMKKLLPRIEGGGGAGCPILVFGISPRLYVED